MKDVIATVDWGSTPLGPQADWPLALRMAVDLIAPAKAQMVLFAGPDLVAIYNSAGASIIGDRHPHALGRPGPEGFATEWDALGHFVVQVRETGESCAVRDAPVLIDMHGGRQVVHCDISFSPVTEADGTVSAVLCILSATSNPTHMAEALSRREEQIRALMSQANIGIVVADPDQTISAVNDHFTAMTGYDEDDLRGRTVAEILLAPADGPDGREEQLRCKDGRIIWVSRSDGPILDAQGAVSQIGMIFGDVTARRMQEADMRRMAALIASSDDAILATDLETGITSWNEGATRLYGYEASEMIGQSVLTLVPEERRWEEARILDRIRAGGAVQSHETLRLHRDGRVIDVSLTVSPIYDEAGVVVGASKIARNISDRRTAEKMQRVLVDEMKHRVKNILATVHAIARQTFGPVRSPETEAFEARLFALSRAQDLITREALDGVALAQLLREVLAPYPASRITMTGPVVDLTGRAALSLTLGFHELATNAAKYGALSDGQGQVAITWQIAKGDPDVFTLRWEESGGPVVAPPARRGFGSGLVRVVVPAELGGEAELAYAPSGFIWQVRAPMGAWVQEAVPAAPKLSRLFDTPQAGNGDDRPA